jgi:hypothetical protein
MMHAHVQQQTNIDTMTNLHFILLLELTAIEDEYRIQAPGGVVRTYVCITRVYRYSRYMCTYMYMYGTFDIQINACAREM